MMRIVCQHPLQYTVCYIHDVLLYRRGQFCCTNPPNCISQLAGHSVLFVFVACVQIPGEYFHPLHEQHPALNTLLPIHKTVFNSHFTMFPGMCLSLDIRQHRHERTTRRGPPGSLEALGCGKPRTIHLTCDGDCMRRLVTVVYNTFDVVAESIFADDDTWQQMGEIYAHTTLTWIVGSVLTSIIQQLAVLSHATRRTTYYEVSYSYMYSLSHILFLLFCSCFDSPTPARRDKNVVMYKTITPLLP